MQVACNGLLCCLWPFQKETGAGHLTGVKPGHVRGWLCPRRKLTQQQIIISALFHLYHKCDPMGRLGGLGLGLGRGVSPVQVGRECGLRLPHNGDPLLVASNALWITQTLTPEGQIPWVE